MSTLPPLLDPQLLSRLEQLEIISKKMLNGRMKGERLSRRKGNSSEFADFRNYVIGDDLRFLDWNLYARLEKLFLRIFFEEEDLHFTILIDNSASMDTGDPHKFHYARQIAAALGYIGLCNLDRVQIMPFHGTSAAHSPHFRGKKSLSRMLQSIDELSISNISDFSDAMRNYTLRATGKGVVVIVSDFLDKSGYEKGFRDLIARNLDIYAIQVLSPEEVNPALVGDLKLVDCEDGDTTEITISAPLLARYQSTLAAFRRQLAEFCTRRGIAYLFTTSAVPFDRLVLNYLRQRGLVR
ncbi:DUF58 domain-containing protein [Tuwongella immobilis]|uniref:DUF58 domain-containing protein n=1 Tax=Tuwongella immobilis TaxID=692036 RepID=A0A6C2YUS9_9BACT|nr:DUF58 domain-containing protein [Tuwongella immobilis]VIP05256.1 Uncharacterized protein OS=Singulisphaera acidiphila (strain ATCC BAA-1392 / DSM 18658 / VKM B-2454 / MOB10) GN=Sinac_2614 PE=4 SV=1: DUF58 [Tuwongella immobilis]VTS07868.1 Uncharacterized protein OS=Singulisphaera acidiphila (strain ATCC BAA-1392 / DSM 18658 / VKM B-2454 / MOB10) GN=Sinac_2614 PE=4 SV=1: DUF58 [Tuwongella immobilis]